MSLGKCVRGTHSSEEHYQCNNSSWLVSMSLNALNLILDQKRPKFATSKQTASIILGDHFCVVGQVQ